jgi:hypothetical protein
MRSCGAWSHGNASVTWREIHSAVGFAVTPNDTQSRRVAATYAGNADAAKAFHARTGIDVYCWDVSDFDSCIGRNEWQETTPLVEGSWWPE